MAFEASNADFYSVFGKPQALKPSPSRTFLDSLTKYLLSKPSIQSAHDMGVWLSEKRPVSAFLCREDVVTDLAECLTEKGIPYAATVSAGGDTGFLIRAVDAPEVERLSRQVLDRMGHYLKVMSGQELREELSRARGQDKNVLSISGLSGEETRIFLSRYREYKDGSKVGVDRMQDQTYTISLPAGNSIKKSCRDGVDVCRIYLESAMAARGPNGSRNTARAILQERYEKALAHDFREEDVNLMRTPLWIVGTSRQYMKVTGRGFEYGYGIQNGDEVTLTPTVQADTLQPNYRQMLISYGERIPNKRMTYDSTEVINHFRKNTNDAVLDVLDTTASVSEKMTGWGEKKIAALMDTMVMRKIQGDSIMLTGKHDEKLLHYALEAASILEAVSAGYIPDGFEAEDMGALRALMDKYGIEETSYKDTAVMLSKTEVQVSARNFERITDLDKELGNIRERREMDMERDRTRGRRNRASKER